MTTRSLLRILLVLGVGWLTLLSPSLFTLRSILRDADGYSRAEYLVTGGHCDEGDERVYCFLEGKVLLDRGQTSSDEDLSVGFSLTHPAGARLAVFYNPTRVSERVLEANGAADAAQLARRRLWEAARLLLLVLGSAAFVHVLLRTGPGRVGRGPRQLAIDLGGLAPASGLGGALPAIGTVLFSQGLTLLAWQISHPEIGGIVLGLLLAAAGTPLLVRRFLVLAENQGKAIRGWHFLGLRFRKREESLPVFDRVGLRRAATDDFVVFIAGPDASERVEASSSLISARDRARRLASLLGVPLEDATAGLSAHPAAGRFRARALLRLAAYAAALLALLTAALAFVGPVPSLRVTSAAGILEPSGIARRIGPARRWALTRLAGDRDPAALLQLLRVLNTVDAERFPEIAADVDAAASRRAGLPPLAERDRAARLLAINAWAAAQLGRSLDGNGGVLGWMPVEPRFVPAIERIASPDAQEAWLAWNDFAADDLVTAEQWVYAVGPALADGRKIRFAIYRNGPLVEAQPVPVESRPDALAHTVGEALALHLWQTRDFGAQRFPDDFNAWWAQWSRARRLPPAPDERVH
jgi:hypothetical protein